MIRDYYLSKFEVNCGVMNYLFMLKYVFRTNYIRELNELVKYGSKVVVGLWWLELMYSCLTELLTSLLFVLILASQVIHLQSCLGVQLSLILVWFSRIYRGVFILLLYRCSYCNL